MYRIVLYIVYSRILFVRFVADRTRCNFNESRGILFASTLKPRDSELLAGF